MWPFSSRVYHSVLTPARTATSSRRSPGTRRRPPRRQPDLLRGDPGPPAGEEVPDLGAVVHALTYVARPRAGGRAGPLQARPPAPARSAVGVGVGRAGSHRCAAEPGEPCASLPTPPPPPPSRWCPPPSSAATSARTTSSSTSSTPASATPTSTPSAATGARSPTRSSPATRSSASSPRSARGHQPQVGDRVGVGCMVNSCGECANCRNGDEQYCLKGMVGTYGATDRDGTVTQGGYSTHVVVDAGFVLRVPDGSTSAAAAPLLCAGITTYSPLRHWGAGPGQEGRRRRARRARAHGRQARPRDGRRGHRAVAVAEEAGGRPAPGRRRLLRHQRPGHLHPAGRPLRPDRQHRQRRHRRRRLPRCSPSTARSSTSAPRPSR